MKKLLTGILGLAFFALPITASAITWVDGHYRDDGTYVESHYRSDPDDYEYNNLGSDGIDMDNDGYGVSESSWSNGYDSYDSYSSYDSELDSYSTDNSYDSYDYGYDSYNDYNSYNYDSYDYSF